MKISKYINLVLDIEGKKILSEEISRKIDGFDDAILMLDDIKDKSSKRDGEDCYYIVHGVWNAEQRAKELSNEAYDAFSKVAKEREIGFIRRLLLKFVLWKLRKDINRGQEIDSILQKNNECRKGLISQYRKMIRLFTGGHIKHSFHIGFLLAKSKLNKKVLKVGELIGILRQIDDDMNDYKEKHHEPLGDLVNHKKRLPELLFFLNANEEQKSELQKLLIKPEENLNEIRKLIFNEEVVCLIKEESRSIKEKINKLTESIPEKYKQALQNLTSSYLSSNINH